jgi:hypothetical protein
MKVKIKPEKAPEIEAAEQRAEVPGTMGARITGETQ